MIGKLRGIIESIGDDSLVIDVHGVGYVVHCSTRTLERLPRSDENVSLAIETLVREDAIRLYGFLSDAERDWFRLLQTVQGIGAKMALAILGVLDVNDLAGTIIRQDKAAIARAPGVGPRLAARIVAELKDKAPALGGASSAFVGGQATAQEPPATHDAIAALISLGYSRPQATSAVAASRAALGEDAETAALIRRGLQEIAR